MVLLKRLYVENYKLFSKKELDFSNSLLSVFDGPNGYGKTSIFDAIELLVTGKISRVLDCESIDGKVAYRTVFFAQNCDKDVVLKAEFIDKELGKSFVLGARAKSADINGKIANPKNVFDKIEYFFLPAYDISIDSWGDYVKSNAEIIDIRKREFGAQNIDQFTLFHYIRQEDRLSYFKQSEVSRATAIESLLGVAREREKHKRIQDKRKAIEKVCSQISTDIESKKKRVIEIDGYSQGNTEYESIIDGKYPWDKETVFFGDSNQDKLLAQYLLELEKIEAYVKYADIHSRYSAYHDYIGISETEREAALRALILLRNNPVTVDELDTLSQNLDFLNQQKTQIESQDYESLNCSKLYKLLSLPEDSSLKMELETLSNISKNQSELGKAINNVIQMREKLHHSHVQVSQDGICPYCGHDWEAQEELEKNFASTKMILQQSLSRDGELYAKQRENVKKIIESGILIQIDSRLSELLKSDIVSLYSKFESKTKFLTATEKARSVFNMATSLLSEKGIEVKYDSDYLEKLMDECRRIGTLIPDDYLSANENYTFSELRKKYDLNNEIISKLKKESFEKKRQYLQEQLYKSFDKIKEEIHNLEIKKSTIEVIISHLKEYEKAVKKAIDAYQKQIIDEIEIPFFVYSSRLLQSYQGGQGVLMKTDGSSIRFTSPGKEHDILYTMSSGQLSAIILSFSLALNKIYSGNGIKTLLIDDPIQCMDDINMISFVELLHREFSGCQIILSTHEEDFSNFIRYKFKKYGIDTRAITLKEA